MSAALKLAQRLDMAAATPLKEALLAQTQAKADIELDASEVSHLGALCFQVILSAVQTCQGAGHSLRILNASDEIQAGFHLLGLPEDILGESAT